MTPKNRFASRIARRTPSGGLSFHRVKKRAGRPRCALCSLPLRASSARSIAHTQRAPSRAFGGFLCPSCLGEVIALAARVASKDLRLSDVEPERRALVEKIL